MRDEGGACRPVLGCTAVGHHPGRGSRELG